MASQSTLDLSRVGNQDSEAYFDGEEEAEEHPEESPEEPIDPRSLLTPQQIQDYKDIFSELDPQKHGKIPTKLLGTVIRNLGYNPTKAQIREYMSMADPEGKGVMDFQGFLLPIAEMIDVVPESFEDLLRAFKTLDEDDLGYITVRDFNEYMTTLGEYLEDFEIELLIKMATSKVDGNIRYEEFLEKQFGIIKKKQPGEKGKKKKK